MEDVSTTKLGKQKRALAKNLPLRGWKGSGELFKNGNLTISLRKDGWILFKDMDGKDTEIASGAYGRNQMNDVRKAVKRNGGQIEVLHTEAERKATKTKDKV